MLSQPRSHYSPRFSALETSSRGIQQFSAPHSGQAHLLTDSDPGGLLEVAAQSYSMKSFLEHRDSLLPALYFVRRDGDLVIVRYWHTSMTSHSENFRHSKIKLSSA